MQEVQEKYVYWLSKNLVFEKTLSKFPNFSFLDLAYCIFLTKLYDKEIFDKAVYLTLL